MRDLVTRRGLLGGALALAAMPRFAWAQDPGLYGDTEAGIVVPEEQYYNPDLLPPPESEIDFPVEPVSPRRVKKKYRLQMVDFEGTEEPGTLVVDPDNRFLYHVLAYGQAKRYGVGVGRAGFAWAGDAKIGMKRRWPRWVPPREMVDRDERARKWVNGQPGGPDNPLGARALYLYANGADTLYRIHGTNEPDSIGEALSSGCIRMLNQDVAELFDNVIVGTPVSVRPSTGA
jgi:lipoprotein-anchoring transpeptidase ErfK/SrfK